VLSALVTRANASHRIARAEARAGRWREVMLVVPRVEIAAPLLYVASAVAHVDAWICGSRVACAGFDLGLRGLSPPVWIRPLAGRGSARVHLVRRARLTSRVTDAYLAAVDRAPVEDDYAAAAASQTTVLDVLRAHAPSWAIALFR
jgi:hypothetical protein